MAQQAKVLDTKSGDLSLLPGTHTVAGESQLFKLSPSLYMHVMAFVHACIHTNK